jgi:hypothetical protein
MENYNIYLSTEKEKYSFLNLARQAGATVSGVSGCGSGYYIQIEATPAQVEYINKNIYTAQIDSYTAAEAWQAWKAGRLTVGQLAEWQQQHGIYFTPAGRIQEARI